MATTPAKDAEKRRARRKQRQPTYHPFFRRKNRRRVQDGFRVCWYEADTRRRAWVRTEKEALDMVSAKQGAEVLIDAGYHQVATFLDPLQVRVAERCFQILHDESFLDLKDANTADRMESAVKWFAANYRPPSMAPTVTEFAATFETSRRLRDKRTRDDYRSTLNPFVKAFATKRIDEISAKQISEFIAARPVGNTTKSKLWSILRVFFNLACKQTEYGPRWLVDNPVKQVTRPNAVTPKRLIYSLGEVKELIQAAIYLGCAPIVVFRLYTMLRADEAQRFLATDVSVPYSGNDQASADKELKTAPRDYRADIHFDTLLVDYQEPSNSKYTRKITILPVLEAWLRILEERGIPLCHTRLEEEARRIGVPKKFGMGFDNLIRHTAISNYVTHSKSLADTAYAAGTSEGVISKHYRDYVSPESATAFFELTPDKFDLTTMYAGRRWRSEKVLAGFVKRFPLLRQFLSRRTHHREAQHH